MNRKPLVVAASLLLIARGAMAETKYDLLLQGGHVIDPKSGTSGVRDVAIAGGRSPPSCRGSTPPRPSRSWTFPDST